MRVVSLPAYPAPERTAVPVGHRYQPPRMTDPLVARPGLWRCFAQVQGQVVLLAAPQGSGKTTALYGHYAEQAAQGRPVRWLTLSADDNDPAVLRRHLMRAFAADAAPDADELPDVPDGIVGFVDGLDCLTVAAAHEMAERFVLSLPAGSCVLVATTRLRGSLLHEGRLRGVVRVIGHEALRMHDGEAAEMLGDGWLAHQVEYLNRLVDGWAAGLRFLARAPAAARQLLGGAGDRAALPPDMADYFDDVVCAAMTPETLAVLTELSVLARFPPALVAALPSPPCDWPQVEEYVRSGLFMRYADERREWVVFHAALGRFLRHRLRSAQPARYDALRRFAAAWCRQHGYAADAVRHAVAITETPVAARLLEDVGAISVGLGDGPDVQLDEYITASRAGELPSLFISQVYHRLRYGKTIEARAVFEQAKVLTHGFTRLHPGADVAVIQAWAHLFDVVFLTAEDRQVDDSHIDMFEANLKTHLGSQPVLAASIASVLAFLYLDRSRHAESAATCGTGLRALDAADASKVAVFLHIHQASNAIARDSLGQAVLCIEAAQRLACIEGGSDSYEVQSARIMRAILHYENNEFDAALPLLLPALEQIRQVNGWVKLYAEAYAAAAAMVAARHGLAEAERILRAGEAFARERKLTRLSRLLQVTRLRELTRAGDWKSARTLVEQPAFAWLLASDSLSSYDLAQQLPALLGAAQLMVALGRPGDAMPLLARVNMAFLEHADSRWRFSYRVLAMRAAYGLRRYNAAFEHMQAALGIACHAGLVRRALDERVSLIEVFDWARRNGRSIPGHLGGWVDQALRPAVDTEHGALLRQPGVRNGLGREVHHCVLSPRESETIVLMAEGYSSKEIATRLGISEGTVKTHRKKIHEKLGVTSRSQALLRARELLII